MKINKNKAKYLAPLIPLSALWGSFALGHLLDMQSNTWWAFPYALTWVVVIVSSLFWSIITVDRHYYD